MTAEAQPQASILIPQLTGGGAEKIVMGIASELAAQKRLSRVYTGSAKGMAEFPRLPIIDLRAERALAAIKPFAREVRGDAAGSFLLTLGYMNLAPLIRLIRPAARIVIRLGSIPTAEAQTRKGVQRFRYRAGPRLAYAAADLIIVQGEHMRDDVLRDAPSIERKVRIIHNYIEPALFEFEPAERPLERPYLFCASTFRPEKGLDVLIRGFARSPARRSRVLVIAGVRPDDEAFAELVTSEGLKDAEVVPLGFVPRPYAWIAHADLCVLTSRYEGFSNFLLEAAAMGKRIVATDCPGGNAELLRCYGNGTLVPQDDPEAISEALAEPRRDLPLDIARSRLEQFGWPTIFNEYCEALFGDAAVPSERAAGSA